MNIMNLLDSIIIPGDNCLNISIDGFLILLIGQYGSSLFYPIYKQRSSTICTTVNLYFEKDTPNKI